MMQVLRLRQLLFLSTIVSVLAGTTMLIGCAVTTPASGSTKSSTGPSAPYAVRVNLATPVAWGGEAHCHSGDCGVAVVDHRAGEVVLWRLNGRSASLRGRHDTAYHPDWATWLDDSHVVVAVERTHGLDIFAVDAQGLRLQQQIDVGFAPRRVTLLGSTDNGARMLVTPYSGRQVAWVQWDPTSGKTSIQKSDWCATPWHPVMVSQAPAQSSQTGVAVGCLDDGRVIWVPTDATAQAPLELARFDAVPRQVRPSPSGRWLYVALETGGHNARIDMISGQVQHLRGWESGAVAVAPLADDLVIWGDDRQLHLQQIAEDGSVTETRWLDVNGFSTTLQLIDLDGDDELDLLVLNSTGEASEIIYGPLWENARTQARPQ